MEDLENNMSFGKTYDNIVSLTSESEARAKKKHFSRGRPTDRQRKCSMLNNDKC